MKEIYLIIFNIVEKFIYFIIFRRGGKFLEDYQDEIIMQ